MIGSLEPFTKMAGPGDSQYVVFLMTVIETKANLLHIIFLVSWRVFFTDHLFVFSLSLSQ